MERPLHYVRTKPAATCQEEVLDQNLSCRQPDLTPASETVRSQFLLLKPLANGVL